MEVILIKDVPGLGFQDEKVIVKDGYGRNYLIPQGLCVLANKSNSKILEEKLSHIKEPINLSIIGCVVNGPGEASQTDIGITGGGRDSNMLYLNGIQTKKLNNREIISKVIEQVENKASEIQKKAK